MAPTAALTSYEQLRLDKIEENKKRMQEMGILEASKELTQATLPNRSHRPLFPHRGSALPGERRTSSRVASLSKKPDYRNLFSEELRITRRRGRNPTREFRRGMITTAAMVEALEAAEALSRELVKPYLIKSMTPSQIAGGFWMGLQSHWCRDNMPEHDATVVLEDDNGQEWDSIYKTEKTAFSGGWRGFALDHHLEEGDAIVFEVVSPSRVKVHIFRAADQPAANVVTIPSSSNESDVEENDTQQDGGKESKGRSRSNSRKSIKGENKAHDKEKEDPSRLESTRRAGKRKGPAGGGQNGDLGEVKSRSFSVKAQVRRNGEDNNRRSNVEGDNKHPTRRFSARVRKMPAEVAEMGQPEKQARLKINYIAGKRLKDGDIEYFVSIEGRKREVWIKKSSIRDGSITFLK